MNLLQKILIDAIEKMDESLLKDVVKGLDIKTNTFTPQAVIVALQIEIRNDIYLIGNIAYIIFASIAMKVFGDPILVLINIVEVRILRFFADL